MLPIRKFEMFFILMAIFLITACQSKYIEKTTGIDKIDTSGIYFKYTYLENSYEGFFDLNDFEENFYSTDSLIIKIKKNHPSQFELVSIKKRKVEDEIVLIPLSTNSNSRPLYSFHIVDRKPLFPLANNEYENDSLLFQFFEEKSIKSKDFRKIGVFLLINGEGKPSVKNITSQNEDEIKIIKNLIHKLPNFTAPYHKGDTVSVSYLIEVPLFN